MWFPYNTEGFKGLNNKSYMFFREPNDLAGLDISNGQCLNTTIPQNVTFDRQTDGKFRLGSAGGKMQGSAMISFIVALVAAMFMTL
jgi:hypothetical protein